MLLIAGDVNALKSWNFSGLVPVVGVVIFYMKLSRVS